MPQPRTPKQLSKFISYILGHNPDEFGLVLDQDGFIKIKELLKAITEEDGWKYVRRSHIDEILITMPGPPVEIKENLIRAKIHGALPKPKPAQNLPRLLYTCVRKKAYPAVLDKGIYPTGYNQVILSSSREMAERIGKRTDQTPILITILAQKSAADGVVFYQAGNSIYLAESIPAGYYTGPLLPKQKPELKKQATAEESSTRKLAGSFFMDLKYEKKNHKKSKRGKSLTYRSKPRGKSKKEARPWLSGRDR